MARGEEELRTNLQKLPWSCYLPIKRFDEFSMPPTRANCHQSKLFHSKMVREILMSEINDLPIQKDYYKYKKDQLERGKKPLGFKKFKMKWLREKT